MSDVPETITVTDDGLTLPVTEVLAGRGFITGKSGSGKSNSASVVVEELLENNFAVLIIDTDGEYYGLKERYEILHVGAGPECDVEVGPGHAKAIAEVSLVENVPVILDISAFLDADEGRELVREVVETLFRMEGRVRKPFLLVVEEAHEFLPESGGLDDLGELLVRVAKRGRKRGLGLCGISQRPAAVDKDFITQCDWLVWHRLTWDNDTRVVKGILGSDAADTVQDLGDGEALLMTDWDDQVQQVQFRRKRTFDAGATPGLGDFERPDLKSVGDDLLAELQALDDDTGDDTTAADHEAELKAKDDRITALESTVAELEAELEAYEAEIEDYEARLEAAEPAADGDEHERTATNAANDDEGARDDAETEEGAAVIGTTDPVPGGDDGGLLAPLESILTPGDAAPAAEADVASDTAVDSSHTRDESAEEPDDADTAAGDTGQDDGLTAGLGGFLDDGPSSTDEAERADTASGRSTDREATAKADGAGTASGRGTGPSGDAAEDGSVDPLWEIGELIIYLIAGVRRLLVGGTQAVGGSAPDTDRSNVRPITGGTEERELALDRRTEGVLVILAIAAALGIFYLLVIA